MKKKIEKTPEELKEEISGLKKKIREQIPEVRKAYEEYYTKATKLQHICDARRELEHQLAEAEKRVIYLKPGQSGKKKGGEKQEKNPQDQLTSLLKGMTQQQKEEFVRDLLG